MLVFVTDNLCLYYIPRSTVQLEKNLTTLISLLFDRVEVFHLFVVNHWKKLIVRIITFENDERNFFNMQRLVDLKGVKAKFKFFGAQLTPKLARSVRIRIRITFWVCSYLCAKTRPKPRETCTILREG